MYGQRGRDSIRQRRECGRYLVVHTGRVTEKEYFIELKKQLRNGALIVKYGKNLSECVRIALEEGHKAEAQGDSFDGIFVVDDVDGRDPKQLREFCKPLELTKLPIEVIFSNPCIEVWFLCYLDEVSNKAGTPSGAQRLAKKHGLIGGGHGKNVKAALFDHEKAMMIAQRLKASYGDDVMTCVPTTDLDLVVGRLLQERKED